MLIFGVEKLGVHIFFAKSVVRTNTAHLLWISDLDKLHDMTRIIWRNYITRRTLKLKLQSLEKKGTILIILVTRGHVSYKESD